MKELKYSNLKIKIDIPEKCSDSVQIFFELGTGFKLQIESQDSEKQWKHGLIRVNSSA